MARRVVLCLPDGAPTSDPAPAETAKRDVELANPELVDRLALVSAEPTEGAPAFVDAKTLLIFGSLEGGRGKATWWKNRIGGRIEMVPREGREILGRVWTRVLSHLAPRSAR